MTEYDFAAQYQQNPIPPGGNMVKREWLKFYDPASTPKFAYHFQSWDTASKAEELSAYSVCTTWGIERGDNYYLLDVFRKRLNYPELKYAVAAQQKLFPRTTVLIEDKASGTQLIQELKREMPIKPYSPPAGADKEMRLYFQTYKFASGHVFLPQGAPWLKDYLDELTGFPNAKYDDQVDSTTQFLDYITQPKSRPLIITDEFVEEFKNAMRKSRRRGPY